MILAEQLILYHRTSKENVESILKNGLLRNKAKSLKCIYLSKCKDTSFGDVLFEVTLNSNKYPKCYRLSDWEHIVFHDISPEDITLIYAEINKA